MHIPLSRHLPDGDNGGRGDAQGALGFVFPAYNSIPSTTTTPSPPHSPMSTTPPAVPSSSSSDEPNQTGKPNGVPETLSSLSAMSNGVSDNFEWKQGETPRSSSWYSVEHGVDELYGS